MKIKPMANRVLVEIVENGEEMKGGIIIPDTAQEKSQEAVVIEVGPDRKGRSSMVEVGDKVLLPKYGGSQIKIDGQPYQLINESDIIAVIG